MWSAIASLLLGAIGWLVTSFFAKPLLDFLDLKKRVFEEIIFTGNIGAMVANEPAFEEAVDDLRRLGAQLQATAATDSIILRLFLAKRGYDLMKAGRGLIGLSNSLHTQDGSRALQTNSVQVGLKLPRDYDDTMIQTIAHRMQNREDRVDTPHQASDSM